MRGVRRVLGTIATLWLCSQAATMTLAAAMIGMVPFADVALQCTCAHEAGDSATCPMHHTAPRQAMPAPASPHGEHAGHAGHPEHATHVAHTTGHAAQPASQAPTPGSGGTCYMRSADTASNAALVSVFGPLGLLAPATFSLAPSIVNPHGVPTRILAIDRTLPPDPPPPRG
jgi:hypothetical protein